MESLNLTAEMTLVGLKPTKGTPCNFVTAKFALKVESKDAKALLGDDFYKAAFGTLQFDVGDAEAEPVFGYHAMTMKEQLAPHIIKMFGFEHKASVTVETVTPVKGERAVEVVFSAQFAATESDRPFTGALMQKFDTRFEVSLTPAQIGLFDNVADLGEEDDAEVSELPGKAKRRRHAPDGVVGQAKTGPYGNPAPVIG